MAKTALIVDDSRSMRQMVGFILKRAGFEVLEGEDGQDGLRALSAAGRVDLIVTDLNMPVMDGLAFVEKARQQPATKLTPILILTTECSDERKKLGKAAGATGWIVKPFQPEQFMAVIQKVVPL